LIEYHEHFRTLNPKGLRGADGGAEPAMGAFSVYAPDFLGGVFYHNPLVLQIPDPFLELFPGSGKLQNHGTFFPGRNGCIEDIEGKIVIFHQIADQRFMNFRFRKS
jgi:hypothetical protein